MGNSWGFFDNPFAQGSPALGLGALAMRHMGFRANHGLQLALTVASGISK